MKAVGLLSGGLDSTLAVQLMVDQGTDVQAVKFTSPFCQCDSGGCCHAAAQAQRMGIPLKTFAKGDDYLDVVRNPKHGRGSAMNPCIDCRIFMLRKTKVYMDEIGAAFLFTGEVLGQRPMSQRRHTLRLIEREAGLEGRILRPLSAQHFPPTEAETKGWVNRDRLLAFSGRSRKPQIALAAEHGITTYACPAGGCLLTDERFSNKLRDLFAHQEHVTIRDMRLLKIGRHFRLGHNKVICARDKPESDALRQMQTGGDSVLEAVGCMGPIVLLQGEATDEAVRFAATVVAAYASADAPEVAVLCRSTETERKLHVARTDRSLLQPYKL
jgi:tRNA U34 2-thiouridine synthase MnmA/TrmU